MGIITIQSHTTKNPITLIGQEAGICYGADITNEEKNYKRGLDCIRSGHGRTLEFPQVYCVLEGYSARVIRELYTHIGGAPTRLQASTRYIPYKDFSYIVPPSIQSDPEKSKIYWRGMAKIKEAIADLEVCGVAREDVANLLPLGMQTTVVLRTNLRNLIDMSRQRMCNRAYWEFRQLMQDLSKALSEYSQEWSQIIQISFHAKCEEVGYCTEEKCCGRYPKRIFGDEPKQNSKITKGPWNYDK